MDTTNNYKITAQIFVEVFPYIDADEDIQKLTQKVVYLNTVVDFLDRTLRIIVNRTYVIKNAIEWKRFTSGAI